MAILGRIAAYSPQARGRSERMFATLQDLLPKELALAGVTSIAEANRYLVEVYLPRHNEQFSVDPKEADPAYVPWVGASLDKIFCIQEDRTVQNDNTVRYRGKILQIPKDNLRHHYIKTDVQVREYLDGNLGLFYGPRCLGHYNPDGTLLVTRIID